MLRGRGKFVKKGCFNDVRFNEYMNHTLMFILGNQMHIIDNNI